MANNLKQMRERAGMSMSQLARKVGATALQIKRIESNKYPSPIHLATQISAALDAPLNAVFPGAANTLAALADESTGPGRLASEKYARLREVGLEGDARQHVLKVLLRGHPEPMFFHLLANEVDRIFQAVQSEITESSFIVFDTNRLRVAIKLQATMCCHFLWDADFKNVGEVFPPETTSDEDDTLESVQVYFAENSIPVTIGVNAENGDEIDSENNYLNNIFGLLENDVPPHQRLHIVDEDGESAFLRVGDVTLITVPLWALDPDERVWDEEDED